MTLKPNIELLMVSSPMFTFSVSAFSEKWSTVAPMEKSLLKAYCISRPRSVLRWVEKSDWFSSVTDTL